VLQGFVNAVSGVPVATTWRRFYQISFFFGYIVSASLYYMFSKLSPPPGLGEQVDFDVDGGIIVEGVEAGTVTGADEKHSDRVTVGEKASSSGRAEV
jgi:NCS1 family nucleobase:cation symporter-1